jgi:NADPH:quinone reductase-like Zn-dependent oxidoreductase
MMKAMRIHAYGGTEVFRLEDAAMPEIGPKDILLKVVATSVNPVDCYFRMGKLSGMLPVPLPWILGLDASGIVAAVGSEVTRFKVGDAVYSRPDIMRPGTYAEYVAIDEAIVAMKPATISHVEAASLPLVSITAWETIVRLGEVRAGERVLVHAGSGGVGSIAVQLAKARGAHVIATTSARNAALVRSLGADEVIDYQAQVLSEATGNLDMVLDTIGGETQTASWPLLKKGGILVSVVSKPSDEVAAKFGVRTGYLFIEPNAAILEEVAALVDAGKIRPVIGAEFALADLAEAHELSQSRRARGKIVVYVGQP